jgi:hypothetical protein
MHELLQKPAFSVSLILALLITSAIVLGVTFFENDGPHPAGDVVFFSHDDGQSYFVEAADRTSGFDYEGLPAYRAHVFRAGNHEPFVGYLERSTAPAPAASTGSSAAASPRGDPVPLNLLEIKKPGEPRWVKRSDPAASRVLRIVAPEGQDGPLEPVFPE